MSHHNHHGKKHCKPCEKPCEKKESCHFKRYDSWTESAENCGKPHCYKKCYTVCKVVCNQQKDCDKRWGYKIKRSWEEPVCEKGKLSEKEKCHKEKKCHKNKRHH